MNRFGVGRTDQLTKECKIMAREFFWLFGNGQFLRSDSTLVCLPNSQKFCANGLCGFQNLESHSKLGRLRLCNFMCLVSTDRFCLGNVFFRA